jgi:hypothetical protein
MATIKDVIEEHRLLVGAEDVHVTLAEGATPEGLKVELENIRQLQAKYNSFPEVLKQTAQVISLKRRLWEIASMCKRNIVDTSTKSDKDYDELRLKIFNKCDMLFVNLKEDIEVMEQLQAGIPEYKIKYNIRKAMKQNDS